MTSEIRTTIEAGDIAAIEIECTTCNSRQTAKIAEWHGYKGCANCGAPWPLDYSAANQGLAELAKLLKNLAGVKDIKSFPFAIRLELKPNALKDKP